MVAVLRYLESWFMVAVSTWYSWAAWLCWHRPFSYHDSFLGCFGGQNTVFINELHIPVFCSLEDLFFHSLTWWLLQDHIQALDEALSPIQDVVSPSSIFYWGRRLGRSQWLPEKKTDTSKVPAWRNCINWGWDLTCRMVFKLQFMGYKQGAGPIRTNRCLEWTNPSSYLETLQQICLSVPSFSTCIEQIRICHYSHQGFIQ